MPIPSPADFRNRTKTNAQMREMLAEMAGSVALKDTGEATIAGNLRANINYITSNQTLVFSNTVYVISGTTRYALATPQTLQMSLLVPSRLEYVISTGLLQIVNLNAPRVEGTLNIATMTAAADTLMTTDLLFNVDGAIQHPAHAGDLIVASTNASRIFFDDATSELKLQEEIRLRTPYVSRTLTGIPLADRNISYAGLTGTYFLEFNLGTAKFAFRPSASFQPLNTAQLGRIEFLSGKLVSVDGIKFFTSSMKLSLPPQFGTLVNSTASRIAINNTAKTLTLSPSVRIKSPLYSVTAAKTIAPNANVVVPIPATTGSYRLEYDIPTEEFSFKLSSSTQAANTIQVATAYVDAPAGINKLYGVDFYTVDGGSPTQPTDFQGTMTTSDPSSINFDFVNKILTIAPDKVRLTYATESGLLGGYTIDITTLSTPNFWHRLAYNTKTKAMRFILSRTLLVEGEVEVAQVNPDQGIVLNIPSYQINGQTPRSNTTTIKDAVYLHPYGDLEARYVQPMLPGYASTITGMANASGIYALYDALAAQYPDYITKTLLGADAVGNEIFQYRFTTLQVQSLYANTYKPKVILFSNIHGWEKAGTMNVYLALKEICERWQTDSKLEALKWGVDFVVVPVCNPSGFITGTRGNHNGVDLARNFPAGWSLGTPGTDTYGGPSPMSEAETVIMNNVMQAHKDAICFISHHNFSGHGITPENPRGSFIWAAAKSIFAMNLAKSLVIYETIETKKRYAWMPQQNDYYVGYASLTMPPGSEANQAQEVHGIQGTTYEICQSMVYEPEGQRASYSSAVATVGVESLINWILLNVKHACDLYNSRINL